MVIGIFYIEDYIMADLRFSEIVGFIKSTLKGAPNGVAPLDSNSKVPLANLPSNLGGGTGNTTVFTFEVNFNASGAPSTITNLPSGWSASISSTNPNIVEVNHTANAMPKYIGYFGYSNGNWRYRTPPGQSEMFVSDSLKTIKFSFTINTNIVAADLNSKAIINVIF
jgi:hypothetical protein